MNWAIRFAKSSIGAKFLMATSGAAIIGFVLMHMAGNFQVFLGQEAAAAGDLIPAREAMNAYGDFLKNDVIFSKVLWGLRLGLIGAFFVHIIAAIRVSFLNKQARPMTYKVEHSRKSTFAGRYMMYSGIVIAVFVVYHLLHFTLGVVHGDFFVLTDPEGRHDVYNMLVLGFQDPYLVTFYIFAQALLGLHLGHATSSMMQTLGLNHKKYNPLIRMTGGLVGATVFLGNTSIPVAVLLGMIKTSGLG